MTDRDEQGWPESLAEHLDQLAQAAPHSPGPPLPDARLVEDLRMVYTEYTRAGERVWARLAEHLAERDGVPNQVRRMASESVQSESVEPTPVEHGQFALRSAPRSTSPRRSGSFFTLVAAVLVAAVLVGSAFFVLTGRHRPGGETIGASATPTATPMPTLPLPTPTLPLLAARPGYHVVFRQQGNLVIGHQQSIIGGFTTSTVFTIHVICFGTGSVEVNLGTWIDDKYDCQTSQDTNDDIRDNVDTNAPLTANAHYTILASITGPALWEVFIEAQS